MSGKTKERPILFSAPMVRAILEGRKTQTRRHLYTVQKFRPGLAIDNRYAPPNGVTASGFPDTPVGHAWGLNHWRHLKVGDRLWARETWREKPYSIDRQHPAIEYRASMKYEGSTPNGKALDAMVEARAPWRPSIHMPRWASRINLEVTGVRAERLQDISEADALAEGIAPNWIGEGEDLTKGPNGFGSEGWVEDCGWMNYMTSMDGEPCYTPRESYQSLWESINGRESWAANPWAWVVEFHRVTALSQAEQPK